jgi:glycosyltransferase involved in cell wall biosynthesis
LKVLHVTEYCHAGSTGGTERYVVDLVRGLDGFGVKNAVVWLTGGAGREAMEVEGIRVLPLPAPAMRVDAAVEGLREMAVELMAEEKPDWLHFHTFGLSEAVLAEVATEEGIRCAFTHHSPAWTCRRETGLLFGEEPCDGEVRAMRCSACQSEERLGGSKLLGYAAAAVSGAVGWATVGLGATSLRRRTAFFHDNRVYRAALREFLGSCAFTVACAEWSVGVLERNGADGKAVVHAPQGLSVDFLRGLEGGGPSRRKAGEFCVGYVGRVTAVKGVDLLMEGFSRLMDPAARLRVVGWEGVVDEYTGRLAAIAEGDRRITLVPKTDQAGTIREYLGFDVLGIPSTWLETGPLTLFEGLAAGARVLGSDRVGQIGVLRAHGRVVVPNTAEAWCRELEREAKDAEARNAGGAVGFAGQLRTTRDVAREMLVAYGRHGGACESDAGTVKGESEL